MKLKQRFTPAEALKLVTNDNAQLLALSKVGALADLLLVDGDPTQNLELVGDAENNFKVIMKDGQIHKNTL